MKMNVSVLLVALLSPLASASDVSALQPVRAEATPVVSVIALSAEQARELARVRSEYLEIKARIEADYEARVEAVLGKTAANS